MPTLRNRVVIFYINTINCKGGELFDHLSHFRPTLVNIDNNADVENIDNIDDIDNTDKIDECNVMNAMLY